MINIKLKICLGFLILALSIPSFAQKYDFENEVKKFHNYGFQSNLDSRGKLDLNNRPVQIGYNSKVAVPNNNLFTVTSENNYQIVEYKDNFSLKYTVGPIIPDNKPKELYQCYTNLEAKNIDDRYYYIPRFDFTPVNPGGTLQAGTFKQSLNAFQIVPGDAVVTNIKKSQVTNLQSFTIINDVKSEVPNDSLDPNTIFKTCLIYNYGLLSNNAGESIDISLNTSSDQGLIDAQNVIRRSIFGNSDTAKIDLIQENLRIQNLLPSSSSSQSNTAKKNDFGLIQILAILPALIILILYLRYKFTNKNKPKK
jgi:hypothetical protein